MASEKIQKLIDEVKNLTVLELSELVKALEEEFGVSAAAPMAVAAAPMAGGAAPAAAEEEKTEFDVILANVGQEIKEGVAKEEAQSIKAKLEEVGASVEVK